MKPFNLFFTVVYYLGRALLSVLFPATVEGLDRLPRNGVLLCPNHSSNWDPILIALRLPVNYRLHIMAKEELFKNPILAWILRRLGAFPVSRGSSDIQSVKTAMQAIRSGDNLLIFPEGTTIHNGIGYVDGLPAHAKGGVAVIGVRTGATLVPRSPSTGPGSSSASPIRRYIPATTVPLRRCRRSQMIFWLPPMPWAVRPWEGSRCATSDPG